MKQKGMVRNVIFDTVKKQKWLSLGIVVAVVGAVVAALIPPLILAKIVDTITAGTGVSVPFIVLYFLMLALTGFLESAREGLLTVFGQKITHALRSRLMEKFVNLTADSINQQEPGTLVSRFVGDVDTVENLFTSGIISMFADACKIVSILVVIWFQNRGLTFVLLVIRSSSGLRDMCRKICWQPRSRTGKPLAGLPLMCRRPCTTSGRSIASAKRIIWKSVTTSTSARAIRLWSGRISMTPSIHR